MTPSEAIRRALMRVANEELAEHRARQRRKRVAVLERLIEISSGQSLDEELQRIQEERDQW